ncbi:MAG: alpha/beta hydrolase, partial [Chloroflexota bacterium]
ACVSNTPQPETLIDLEQCYLERGLKAECGSITVFENRGAGSGRELEIHFAVIRATGGRPVADPIFFLAGGPGQSAIETFPFLINLISDMNETRDFVFVDQRGTGQSAPLQCEEITELPPDSNITTEEYADLLEDCRLRLSAQADLSQYTTDIAMTDLDEVRAGLGYETINLVGISYGSRAAQVYMHMFPERTRRVILDAVVSPSLVLNLQSPQTGQDALDDLFARCMAETDCRTAYPTLESSFQTLLDRLAEPQLVRFEYPLDQSIIESELDQETFTAFLFNLMYSTDVVALLPLLIEEAAESGDFGPIVEHYLALTDRADPPIYLGMQMAVVCSEDAPFVNLDEVDAFVSGVFPSRADDLKEQCATWPQREMADGFREPLESDIPVLMLSGESDPITPPIFAEELEPGFTNNLHIRLGHFGHGILTTGCIPELTNDFLTEEAPLSIDTGCIEEINPQPFFVNFAGPPP